MSIGGGSTASSRSSPNSLSSSFTGLGGVPAHLVAMAKHLLRERAEAAIEDIRSRYALGGLVHRVRYGVSDAVRTRALADLGTMFRLKPASLRQLARVTEIIGLEEFERYLMVRGPHGFTLSWSHFEELAQVRNTTTRGRHAEAAITEALSVSDLRHHIRKIAACGEAMHEGAIDSTVEQSTSATFCAVDVATTARVTSEP